MSYKITNIPRYYKITNIPRTAADEESVTDKSITTKSGDSITTKDGKKIIYL